MTSSVTPRAVPILFTIPNFITAGSGRVMLNIIERLDPARFAPAVCVSRRGGGLDRDVERMGIPFIEAPFAVSPRPLSTLPLRAWRAAQYFRPYRFTLWHSFHWAGEYTEPLIARAAGCRHWVFTKKSMGWGSRAWLVRSYLASRIVVDNTDMPRMMFDHVGLRRKVRFIPHGVVVEHFAPVEDRPRGRLREDLGIPQDACIAVCVAHLVAVKGHPTLLEAARAIPGLHIVLAGKPTDDTYAAALRRQASALGIVDRVHFPGGVQDVPALLAEADLFILPTWARGEGCPVALLEAFAAGRACIATDVPGSHDIVKHRVNGLLVPPENSEALAAAIRELVGSPRTRDRLGRSAYGAAVERYRIEREVADHTRLYDEILSASVLP